jgi:hypothetical protein
MTAPRPGDPIHLDLDGTVIAGRYIEVDPPHRLVNGWDHQGTDKATPTPALIEITLPPTRDGTNVKVQLSGLSAEDDAFFGNSGRVNLTGLQLPSRAPNPRTSWQLSQGPHLRRQYGTSTVQHVLDSGHFGSIAFHPEGSPGLCPTLK